MKKFYLMILMLFVLSLNVLAQNYPLVTIQDIQYQNPDSLLTLGDRPSPYLGDTVIVTGIVMNPTYYNALETLRSGAPAVYIQDTTEKEYSGILIRFPGTSTAAFDALDSGTVAKFTGIVTEYNVTTQFDVIEFDGSTIEDFKPRPFPINLTLDSLNELGTKEGKILAEKWEGMLVELRNVTVGSNNIGAGSFSVYDKNNTEVMIGNQAQYFYTAQRPAPGTVLEYVRGFMQNRKNYGGVSNMIIINPVFPEDVKVALLPPAITNITRNPALVSSGQTVTVSAKIKDPDGTVANAKLYWRKNTGVNNEVVMTATSDTTYEAVIPAQPDSCIIDYFLTAEDNNHNIVSAPVDTSKNRYFYMVLDRPLTIQDVQYNPFGGGYSAYNNAVVTVRGIVVADTSDIPVGPQVIIQNGTGPWSGIRVNGTQVLNFKKGDDVTVTGTVIENYNVTNISGINSASDFTLNNPDNPSPLPQPQLISTSDIAANSNGTVSAEQWESVLVQYNNVTVTDDNADGVSGPGTYNYGEIYVADESGINARVELQDGNNTYHNFDAPELENKPIQVKVGDKFSELIGIMYFSHNYYKLIPRTNDDFVGYTTDVKEKQVNVPYQYKLEQNYPNPFNPSTRINYSIKNEGFVSLKVYNILGQQIANLVNEVKTPGNYSINFNASDLSSGIYLYKIESNGFTQTKKMILVR